jgi:hypothetical protein
MIETVPLDQAAAAYAKMVAGKARFRMVLVTKNGIRELLREVRLRFPHARQVGLDIPARRRYRSLVPTLHQRKGRGAQSMVRLLGERMFAMEPLPRRKFISMAAGAGAGLASLNAHDQLARSAEGPAAIGGAIEQLAAPDGNRMAEESLAAVQLLLFRVPPDNLAGTSGFGTPRAPNLSVRGGLRVGLSQAARDLNRHCHNKSEACKNRNKEGAGSSQR